MTSLIKPSVCPLDCAQTCSLAVEVDDGQVIAVRGSKTNPLTDGKICSKVAKGMVELVHGEKRLTTPLRRVGERGKGHFEPISWEEALRTIHQRFQAIIADHGSQAIAPMTYAGPMGLLNRASMSARFFARLGATQVNNVPLCAGTSAAAWESTFGSVGGIAHEEMANSKLIVIWANNITVGHLHITKIIRTARKNGAKVVVVDPRRTRIADDADLFLPIRPGSDVVLAYAVAKQIQALGGLDHEFIKDNVSGAQAFLDAANHWSLEEAAELCGLQPHDIQTFAKLWCSHKPAALSVGVALERTRNGGSAIRAAYALPLLTGNFAEQGAGICDPSGYFAHLNRSAIKSLAAPTSQTRCLSILDLSDHILKDDLDIPLKALFIYNHNPVAVHPQQAKMLEALAKPDLFVVALDHTLTDSVAFADIVLPGATSMEYKDVYKAYGHTHLQLAEPVIEPLGKAKSNTQVFRELAQVFGFDDPEFQQTDEQMISLLSSEPLTSNRALDQSAHSQAKVVFRTCRPETPDNKAQLFDEDEQQRAQLGLPSYKELKQRRRFTVISPSSDKRTNSTFGGTLANKDTAVAEINKIDGQQLGLTDGSRIRLTNENGELILPVRLSDRIRQGVISIDKGAWRGDNPGGFSINLLIPGHKSDMAEGACYNDCQVDIVAE